MPPREVSPRVTCASVVRPSVPWCGRERARLGTDDARREHGTDPCSFSLVARLRFGFRLRDTDVGWDVGAAGLSTVFRYLVFSTVSSAYRSRYKNLYRTVPRLVHRHWLISERA